MALYLQIIYWFSFFFTACSYVKSDQAFLFSLYSHHDNGFKPHKFAIIENDAAGYHCSGYGPTFGNLTILSPSPLNKNQSYSSPYSYETPPSCDYYKYCTFYTGHGRFNPSDVEVFYEDK